ncbi:CRISPR-associated protein, Cse1 family [Aquitalea magnusonii]|uniref:CRISPR-associated protein, Cse1 family n=1 Tax=Aquitalea magnusonii TaxID=332411 RepID=A0A3G9GEW0_9NEIS|nr:type I-E CRISPR-associated protein Cse1/CasA [Aquitalea magnusonii]BBF86005.1 CRISPR-associated protein, Cse1 family [Aquitalea magnusonii]
MKGRVCLLDQAWLPVRYTDGQVREVGLLQLFADADRISGLAETTPPSLIALYRLLLAITHRAFIRGLGRWSISDIKRYYREGLPVAVLQDYLEHWRERFYVFHPTWPFMQVAALATAEETREKSKPWTQISLASSNGNAPVLFDHAVDTLATRVPVAQLLRQMLGFLQYTPGGLVKTVRDSDKAGPLANTAAILPLGDTLAQTLCLALHPASLEAEGDLPAWERPPPDMAALLAAPSLATGPNDRYTRLSRAVLLLPDDENGHTVSQIRFAAGLALAEDEHAPDHMASYRAGNTGMVRLGFSEGRAIWRDLPTFLPDASGKHALPAAVLSHASKLLTQQGVTPGWLAVMVLGVASDKAKLLRWRVERFNLPQALLGQEDAAQVLRHYLRLGEELFGELRKTASAMLAKAMPDPDHKDTGSRARTIFDNGPAPAAYFSSLESRLPQLLPLIANMQADAVDHYWKEARLAAAEIAWASVCRQLGDSARALRARAQSEPFYLGLLKPLRPVTASQPKEPSNV